MAIAPVTSIRPVARTDSPAKKGGGDGIGARQEQKAEELGFFDKVSNFFTTFGGMALQKGKPAKQDNRTLHMEVYKEMDMQDEARRSAEQARATSTSTRSLTGEEWRQRYQPAYTVQSGDSLSKIARENNTTVEALLEVNPSITNPNQLSVSQVITLPPSDVSVVRPANADIMPAPNEETLPTADRNAPPTAGTPPAIYRTLSRKEQEAEGIVTPFSGTGTFTLLKGVEGFKDAPYSLNNKTTIGGKPHKSGLTVGAGLDFGQQTRTSLEAMGVPDSLITRIENSGWLGLNPDTIIDPNTKLAAATRERGHELMWQRYNTQKNNDTLPSFSQDELSSITEGVFRYHEGFAKQQYEERKGSGTWDALPKVNRDILSLEIYHRGSNYNLPAAMLDAAEKGTPQQVARSISWVSRKNNMLNWLSKLPTNLAPLTSPRPQAKPTQE